ncbi:MAG: hypothetical protein FJW86_09705 [Actinobacteria bacterium]|nr:hypothetical protein [Actinomycetota bacterium]
MANGDELPKDLDVTAYVGPYLFPDLKRRRIAGLVVAAVALIGLIGGVSSGNDGLLVAGILLALIAAYHWRASWHLELDQTEALAAASRAVGFPVGHASAQLGWRGLLSRPSWRILLYSADSPPTQRGLAEIDAIDGTILGQYVEDNPEDWSQYGLESP